MLQRQPRKSTSQVVDYEGSELFWSKLKVLLDSIDLLQGTTPRRVI
jgi:hypothetical protein